MVKCHAGSSVATGRISHVKQVKGYDPNKKGIPWSSRVGVEDEADLTP